MAAAAERMVATEILTEREIAAIERPPAGLAARYHRWRMRRRGRQINAAFAAAERKLEIEPRPSTSLFARARRALAARRHRKMVRELDRSLSSLEREDHTSAALLGILTERVALASSAHASAHELASTLELAQRVADDYAGFILRVRALPASDDAARTLARLEAGRRRIAEAIEHLRALAARSVVPPGGIAPPRRG